MTDPLMTRKEVMESTTRGLAVLDLSFTWEPSKAKTYPDGKPIMDKVPLELDGPLASLDEALRVASSIASREKELAGEGRIKTESPRLFHAIDWDLKAMVDPTWLSK